jgi:hypothetical protein
MPQITVYLQDDFNTNVIEFEVLVFEESRTIEINDFLERGIFEFVPKVAVFSNIRIFNSRFVDIVKNKESILFEKSRLVVQVYKDSEKEFVLTQLLTIQRVSQRLIIALVVSLQAKTTLYLRDITQAYVQSKT